MLRFLTVALTLTLSSGFSIGIRPLDTPTAAAATSPVTRLADVVTMGRGDKRTAKGKRKAKSFGVSRPKNRALRIAKEGPGANTGDVDATYTPTAVVEPVADEAEVAEELMPIAEETVAEPEPEPMAEAAPAAAELSVKEIAAAVKSLRAELPKAALGECKEAVIASNGDVEAAKAVILAEKGAAWEEEEAKAAADIAEGLAKVQAMQDAKAAKKFEKEQAAAAEEPAPEPEEAPAPVAEESAPPEPAAAPVAAAAPAVAEGIQAALKERMKVAMRAKAKQELAAVRLINSAMTTKQKEAGLDALDDDAAIAVLTKLGKMRKESIEMYKTAGAEDKVADEQFELDLIQEYLPAMADEASVRGWISEAIVEQCPDGPDKKLMGKVMGALNKAHGGEFDNKDASGWVKEMLA